MRLGLHKAFWDIDYNSGERYRFGHVTFEGSQIRDEYLQNLVPFKEGDEYESKDLAELNRRLSATGWFNSVVVAPQFDKARETKVLPLTGVVSPRTENTIETGVGYSTDVGPRVKATWKKPWMNSYGHSLTTSTSISAPEQTLDFSYKMPLLKNPLEQYYLVQGGFKRTDLNDTESDSTTLVASRYWDLSSGWQRAINLRWSLDHFTQGEITNTTMLFYPGVMISRTRSRGGLMPTWGDSQRYSIDYSNTAWGSDVDFSVFQAQNVWIRTLYDRHRFVTRGTLGWIETGDFDKVPPDLRFFAGGDRSIRGYKYKSIAPKYANGDLKGASKLITGSLEYQYNVTGKWWGAVFVDSGEAVSDIRRSDFKTVPGSACAGNRRSGQSNSILPYRSRIKTNTGYSFTSVWGQNYEFMEKISLGVVIVILLLLGSVAFLVGTTSGLHLVFKAADRWVPGLDIGKVTGGWRDLTLSDVRYEQPGVAVKAGNLHLAVGLECLWNSSVCINDLALKDIQSTSTVKKCLLLNRLKKRKIAVRWISPRRIPSP